MDVKGDVGTDQVKLVGEIVREVCRVIKEEFPDNATEVVRSILVIQL